MSITTSSALPPTNAAIANRRHLHLSTAERRIRNRSLCSLLWTPPLYPGYSAKLENSPKSNCHRSSRKSATSEIPTSSNPILPDPDQTVNGFCSSSIRSVIKSADKREVLSHLQQGENEEMNWNSPKKYTNSKESSGYGSGTSESDLENELQTKKSLENTTTITDSLNIDGDSVTNATTMSDNYNNIFDERTTNRTPIRQQYNRHFTLEKSRRRSVPANLRDAFTDEIVRVLEINGVFQYETDAVSI
uniref:Uncharacterized protein n=1 Tax=Setaria digitata TaxID=48799 RepID=A0A915PSG2_9BILA